MLRVKNGPCAPLRLSSMLSWPATGTTSISVTIGAVGGVSFNIKFPPKSPRWGGGSPSGGTQALMFLAARRRLDVR